MGTRTLKLVRLAVVLAAIAAVLAVPPTASAAVFLFPSATCPDDPGDAGDLDQCIDLMAAGDTLQIKPGLYYENQTVIDEDVTVTGDCKKRTTIDATFPAPPAVGVEEDAFDVTADGATLMCLTIRHAAIAVDADSTSVDNFTADRVTFIDVEFGVSLTGDGFMVRNAVHNGGGAFADGFRITGNDGQISDSVVNSGSEGGFIITGDRNRIVNNKSFKSTDDNNFEVVGDDNVIANNVARNSQDPCFEIVGGTNTITENRATDCGDSAFTVQGDGNTVTRNAVSHTSLGDGMNVLGSDVMLTGNTVRGAAVDGLDVLGDRATVKDNKVVDTGARGIAISGDAFEVTGNTASGGAGDDGIFVVCTDAATGTDCTSGLIEKNTVVGAFSDGSAGFVITDNGHCDAFPCLTIRKNVATDNSQRGFELNVLFSLIEGNKASRNGSEVGEHGIDVTGNDNTVRGNTAKDNNWDGIEVAGDRNLVELNATRRNGVDGLHLSMGDDNVLDLNTSVANDGDGIENDGTDTTITSNVSSANRADCVGDGTTVTVAGNSCADGTDFAGDPGTVET